MLGELLLIAAFGALFARLLINAYHTRWRVFLLALPLMLAWYAYTSWKRRMRRRRSLIEWEAAPIHHDGVLLRQHDQFGNVVATVDPSRHFSVRWERFSGDRAVYFITQDDQQLVVSTLAGDAVHVLRDILRVSNFPCVEAPTYDL